MSLYYTGTQRVECVCYPLSLRSKKMWKLCFGISKKGYLFSSMVSFNFNGSRSAEEYQKTQSLSLSTKSQEHKIYYYYYLYTDLKWKGRKVVPSLLSLAFLTRGWLSSILEIKKFFQLGVSPLCQYRGTTLEASCATILSISVSYYPK